MSGRDICLNSSSVSVSRSSDGPASWSCWASAGVTVAVASIRAIINRRSRRENGAFIARRSSIVPAERGMKSAFLRQFGDRPLPPPPPRLACGLFRRVVVRRWWRRRLGNGSSLGWFGLGFPGAALARWLFRGGRFVGSLRGRRLSRGGFDYRELRFGGGLAPPAALGSRWLRLFRGMRLRDRRLFVDR